MAQAWSQLGHYGGSSTSEQALGGTVPSSHTWQTKVWVANRTAGALTFRVRHAYADVAADNSHYRAYDASCPANDFIVLPSFIMAATDKLYIKQSADGLTFHAEILDIS